MALEVVTGNHASGYALATAGEANRLARGVCCGIYPITPQTEIVEYVAKYRFTKGRVVPVESEHSAMAVCMGASLNGARSFTASSSNGLAYMAENVFAAGFYRLPIVMAAVNRTLGPPWNIWADQGDTLALRDSPWLQFYCETNQEILDTTLLAFRVSEDPRILLPAMVIHDAFILSHTQMRTDLPEQELVDRFLPPCDVPHRIRHEKPSTIGGLAWPQEAYSMRLETQEAFDRVKEVYEEHRATFREIFGRDVGGFIEPFEVEGAEAVLVTSGTITTTAREVVRERRAKGDPIGLVKVKAYRPFPGAELLETLAGAKKVGVIDRNYASGMGGIFWMDLRSEAQGVRDDLVVQDYLAGVGGGDVTPDMVNEVIDDLLGREVATRPIWKGLTA